MKIPSRSVPVRRWPARARPAARPRRAAPARRWRTGRPGGRTGRACWGRPGLSRFSRDRVGERALQLDRSEPKPSRTESRTGLRSLAPARSPSTIAASSGPSRFAAKSAAPASPPLPPLVDTSTIVRGSRAWRTRARAPAAPPSPTSRPRAARSGVAMGEDHDRRGAGRPRALGDHRGSERSPSMVCARKRRVRTEKPPPAPSHRALERAGRCARRARRRRGCRRAGRGIRPRGCRFGSARSRPRMRRAPASR
jgi:hypothetical protein